MTSEKTTCLVGSYAADLIHDITNGRFAMDLDGLTGSREIIDNFNKLVNSMSYELTCEIELHKLKKLKVSSKSSAESLKCFP